MTIRETVERIGQATLDLSSARIPLELAACLALAAGFWQASASNAFPIAQTMLYAPLFALLCARYGKTERVWWFDLILPSFVGFIVLQSIVPKLDNWLWSELNIFLAGIAGVAIFLKHMLKGTFDITRFVLAFGVMTGLLVLDANLGLSGAGEIMKGHFLAAPLVAFALAAPRVAPLTAQDPRRLKRAARLRLPRFVEEASLPSETTVPDTFRRTSNLSHNKLA